MTWLLVALGVAAGVALLLYARLRVRRLHPIPEAVPARAVSELEAGRFRVVGRVSPTETCASQLDGSRCVFVERVEYRTVGSALVPLLREVDHTVASHPFFLEDGTGRLLVDPTSASVEAVTVFEDGGLVAERRLRAGEEVELVASFAPAGRDGDGGPYRGNPAGWQPVADGCGPPRLSYRTVPDMLLPTDDVTAFLRGAGVLALAASALFGVLAIL